VEQGKHLDLFSQVKVNFACASRENAFRALSWDFRSFQSLKGFLNGNVSILSRIALRTVNPPKIKTPLRRRGYQDRGSLRRLDQWLPKDFASPRHRQIEDLDSQLRLLLRISSERGYFVPQDLIEELLRERRSLLEQTLPPLKINLRAKP